ncbi:MAG TPA: prepilin-type N-terminal cleavage/methylation domain-containing protein [Polyangiaceae bacterium]|nr:prepilin-type N-terminal cleavage/methylation domain-containing protein [Polyangiaceae bacterium]
MRLRSILGFTLLEVMVAIAILGLGLTTILSTQVGLFANSSHAAQLSVATGLVRCKMSEVEEKLLREGFPVIDENDSGDCCEDSVQRDFTCKWKIETVLLPNPPDNDVLDPSKEDLDKGPSSDNLGALGALSQIQNSEGAVLGEHADLNSVSSILSGGDLANSPLGGAAAMGGVGAMAPMVMGMVYPELKGMLEASIRKVTVEIDWREGSKDRDLKVVQILTNPTQGGINPELDNALANTIAPGATPTTPTTPGTGTTINTNVGSQGGLAK